MAQGTTVNGVPDDHLEEEFRFSSDLSLEDIRRRQHSFCVERDWVQCHPPRNVLLALVGEVGELSELFQWRGEVARGLPEFTAQDKVRVGEELSDVLIYLVDLAEQCHVDLPTAVVDKMKRNAVKYPSHRAAAPGRGSKGADHPPDEGQGTTGVQREREEGDGSE